MIVEDKYNWIAWDEDGEAWVYVDGPVCGLDEVWRTPADIYGCVAVGSGAMHALTAMDCGLSAKEAVKMAAKRDTSTGGKIRTFRVR